VGVGRCCGWVTTRTSHADMKRFEVKMKINVGSTTRFTNGFFITASS
jgi:hypothetical protein